MSTLSSKSKARQRGRKSGGSAKGRKQAITERLAETYPFEAGEYVEVELRRSPNGANRRQLAALHTLDLQEMGQAKVIAYRGLATGRVLYAVDELIGVRSVTTPKAQSVRRKRKRKKATGKTKTLVDAAVSARTYTAGGGESRLLEVPGAGLLRVEAQRESYALMWPSSLSIADFFAAAQALGWPDHGKASLVSSDSTGVVEIPLDDLVGRLETEKAWLFARVDFEDRALTWAPQYRDLERSEINLNGEIPCSHEVSLSGVRFDPGYATALLVATALPLIVERADELMATAAETLEAYI
jgi:hypothetical protein